jgi:hypothetical protein
MLRTDTGNFNRFLTSLGLLLLAAALLIPYFYFHDTDVLRITQHELDALTHTGREAILSRQHRAANLELWILGLAAALAVGGIACLYLGGKRLRVAQVKEDAAIDRKARRDDVEIQRLTDAEVEEKRDEQALEAAEERKIENAESRPPAEPTRPTRETAAPPTAQASMAQSRATIARIEETVRQTFEGNEGRSFKFLSEVKLVGPDQRVLIDGLFRAKFPRRQDIVLDIKIVRQSRMLRIRIRNFTDSILALLTRYKALSGRPATGWLLIVLPEETEILPVEDQRRLEDQLNSSLVDNGTGSIIHESELSTLPQRFDRLFESS